MSKLIALYGLPGSGKTHHLKFYRENGYRVFDDFMNKSINDNRDFRFSRHFEDIVSTLRAFEPCIITEIRFCEDAFRRDVSRILAELVPRLSIQWHCFDCRTPAAVGFCRDNVLFRAETTGAGVEHALSEIDRFFPDYSVEEGAIIHNVVDARIVILNDHDA